MTPRADALVIVTAMDQHLHQTEEVYSLPCGTEMASELGSGRYVTSLVTS